MSEIVFACAYSNEIPTTHLERCMTLYVPFTKTCITLRGSEYRRVLDVCVFIGDSECAPCVIIRQTRPPANQTEAQSDASRCVGSLAMVSDSSFLGLPSADKLSRDDSESTETSFGR